MRRRVGESDRMSGNIIPAEVVDLLALDEAMLQKVTEKLLRKSRNTSCAGRMTRLSGRNYDNRVLCPCVA